MTVSFARLVRAPALRAAAIVAVAAASVALSLGPARADCQEDISKFMKQRDGVIAQLNALAGKNKKKQLDPIAACPKFRSLSSILNETVAYLEKNKDWCAVPDEVLDGARKQRGQFVSTASQACGIAAKIAKMKAQAQRQAAEGGPMGAPQAQRMPAGPL